MNCPLCNGAVAFSELLSYWVCTRCCEMLARDELVVAATRRTRREYGAKTYPNMPLARRREMGYA